MRSDYVVYIVFHTDLSLCLVFLEVLDMRYHEILRHTNHSRVDMLHFIVYNSVCLEMYHPTSSNI